MGGVVSSIGNAVGDLVGGVGGVVSGVANQIPVIGPYVGPVVGGITGGPVGFATSLAGNALQGNYGGGGGGGGGSSSTPMYAQPNISYGSNTYSYGGNKVNASPYFITGDKGVYNLLPALGQINAGTRQTQYFPSSFGSKPDRVTDRFNKIGAQGAYTPYEAYQDIQAQMANDPTALAAFNKAFNPTTFNAPSVSLFGRNLPIGPSTTSPLGQFYANTPNPYGNQFVDFGLNKTIPKQTGLSYGKLADYAFENKNPFFLPFETTQGATPLGFTPSQNALAAIDTANYLSGYGTAQSAQQQFLRDRELAARAARDARERAEAEARNVRRDNRRNRYDDDDRPNPITPAPVIPSPVTPTPVTPAPVTPTPVTPAPVTPTPVTPAPVTPTPVTPAPVTPTPVTPAPVTPTPVTPSGPGNFVPMRRGGIAALRRR